MKRFLRWFFRLLKDAIILLLLFWLFFTLLVKTNQHAAQVVQNVLEGIVAWGISSSRSGL